MWISGSVDFAAILTLRGHKCGLLFYFFLSMLRKLNWAVSLSLSLSRALSHCVCVCVCTCVCVRVCVAVCLSLPARCPCCRCAERPAIEPPVTSAPETPERFTGRGGGWKGEEALIIKMDRVRSYRVDVPSSSHGRPQS